MKFSNFLSKLGHFLILTLMFCVFVLPIPAIIIYSIYICLKIGFYMMGLLIPSFLALSGLSVNWFLGWAYGAIENTGYVHNGKSMLVIVRDKAYYKRATSVYFTIFALFIVSIIYFIVMLFFDTTWNSTCLIASIIGAIFYFLLAMGTREKAGLKNKKNRKSVKNESKPKIDIGYDEQPKILKGFASNKSSKNISITLNYDSDNVEEFSKNNETIENLSKQIYEIFNTKNQDIRIKKTITKETGIKTKFNFNKYPELFELYNSYKTAKNKSIHLKNDPNNIEEYTQQCSIRDEFFNKLSKQVYEIFNPQKQDLIKKKTNEIVKWDELFNQPYEKLTQKQKDYLIRLLDAYPYLFKNKNFYN